jgi:hypothetical protein
MQTATNSQENPHPVISPQCMQLHLDGRSAVGDEPKRKTFYKRKQGLVSLGNKTNILSRVQITRLPAFNGIRNLHYQAG